MIEVFDAEFARFMLSMGVGGALAYVLFLGYRKRDKEEAERWKGVVETMSIDRSALVTIVKENTAAFQTHTEVVKALHKRLDQERNTEATVGALQAAVAILREQLDTRRPPAVIQSTEET